MNLERGFKMIPRANSALNKKKTVQRLPPMKEKIQTFINLCSKLIIEHGNRHWKYLERENRTTHLEN